MDGQEGLFALFMILLLGGLAVIVAGIIVRNTRSNKAGKKILITGLLMVIGSVPTALFMASSLPETSASNKPSPTPVAQSTTAPPKVSGAEQRLAFVLQLEAFDAGEAIVRVAEGHLPNQLAITVPNGWHYQPQQLRLQMGQNFWKIWARIYSPGEPDKARISIRDLNGNEVGGSRMLAGSLIWVDE